MTTTVAPSLLQETLDEQQEELLSESFEDVQEPAVSVEESDIEARFRDTAVRIVVQRNDFLLPNLIDMLTVHRTINIAPFYQRRLRWNVAKQSRLIESLLVNVPVPPVFLYETEFARYEVMDGQQRISAIRGFFHNEFALEGLELLPELKRKRYHELPPVVKAGLDRRSLSAIVLLTESTQDQDQSLKLRQTVFERLNTGGVRLNAQEIRNCLHSGPFNDFLHKLARSKLYTEIWGIPQKEPKEDTQPSLALSRNRLYMRMADNELVLRFFALLDPSNIRGGMKATIDGCMRRYARAAQKDLLELEALFERSLKLAYDIFGENTFRLPPTSRQKRGSLSASLYDAVMVALCRRLAVESRIRLRREEIAIAVARELQREEFYALVVGRANTREATLERSKHLERLIDSVLDGSR